MTHHDTPRHTHQVSVKKSAWLYAVPYFERCSDKFVVQITTSLGDTLYTPQVGSRGGRAVLGGWVVGWVVVRISLPSPRATASHALRAAE